MAEIAEMPLDNFLVRPKRKLVERYARPESWETLDENAIDELTNEVAGLPSKLSDPDLEAKLFDVLMLKLQLGCLRNDRSFSRLARRVRDIAEALEGKAAIPMVQDKLELILELQTDEFWQDVTVVRLETVRKQLRELVKFIEKVGQKAVYTNFEDEAGEGAEIALPVGAGTQSFERFREKVRHFLRPRERELPLQKLRLGLALTQQDLATLDHMLVDARLGTEENYQTARDEGLGLFIRSLVGLDRLAAMKAFEGFLQGRDLNANQQQFVAMVIEELTRTGLMEASRLFETPFVDIAPTGVLGLFDKEAAKQLQNILHSVRSRAVDVVDS
jgi:type I restriction enzyme R subunit